MKFLIILSDRTRRNNIALKIKRLPVEHRRRFVEKTDEEKEEIRKDIEDADLKSDLNQIKIINESKILDKNGFDSDTYYFVIIFRGKIGWKNTIEIIDKLPIIILELINDYSIKVSLKRWNYDNFYYGIDKYKEDIKTIRPVQLFEKINKELYDVISKTPDSINSYTIEFQSIRGLDKLNEKSDEIKKYIMSLDGDVLTLYADEYLSIYNVTITNQKFTKIIDTLDSISNVFKTPLMKLNYFGNSKKLDFFETKEIEVHENNELETILIIDSGINRNHYKFQDILVGSYDFLHDDFIPCNDDVGHGTNVAGFAAYGVSPLDTPLPTAKIIMIKNYEKNIGFIVNDILSIKKSIELFSDDFSVINLSYSADEINLSLSKIFDKLSFDCNKIITTSAGNIDTEHIKHYMDSGIDYPRYISNYPIFFPGDGRNIVTVGSCTSLPSSICTANSPSPFTRYGVDPLVVKPDLVSFGGNLSNTSEIEGVSLSSEGFGLMTPSHENDFGFIEKHGTSFSSPIIANYFARLKSMTHIQSTALLKSLLLSSCTQLYNEKGIPYDSNLQGFGIPHLELALYSDIHRINYIMEGSFNSRHYDVYDRYSFWFPFGANKFEITLVCEKSNTFYPLETEDYIEFKVYHRGGTGGSTKLKPIIGNDKCFTTYKGEYEIESGSRGLWMADIVPNFNTKYLYPLKMKYGCVVTVSDVNKNNDIWQVIYEHWLREIIDSQEITISPEALEEPITIIQ